MPIPRTREELTNSVRSTFEKLRSELDAAGSRVGNFPCVDDWSVKDLLAVSLLEGVEATAFWRSTRDWLQKNSPGTFNWTPDDYLMFAHFLFAVCVAFTGAILFPFLRRNSSKTLPQSAGRPCIEPRNRIYIVVQNARPRTGKGINTKRTPESGWCEPRTVSTGPGQAKEKPGIILVPVPSEDQRL